MKVIRIEDAKRSLADYAAESEEAVVVTIDGKPVAALMPLENADLETVSLSTNAKFMRIIERSRKRQRKEGGISSSEMRRRLGVPRER
jgi:antitoxin (DNA-binding transcriptional repressor) of toxin-antitoxin stability system